MSETKLLSHCAPVFPVSNVEETIIWYEENLGFEKVFGWGDPIDYAVISRDDSIKIHLTQQSDGFKPSSTHTALYLFTFDVHALFAEFNDKGLVAGTLEKAEYGMTDFDLTDLNGFRLCFGQGS